MLERLRHANAAYRHKRISEHFHNITIIMTLRYEFLSVVRCGCDQLNLENIRDLANQNTSYSLLPDICVWRGANKP